MGLERVDGDDRRPGGDDLVVELVLARDAEHGPLAGRAGQFEREGREGAAAAEIEEQRASGAHCNENRRESRDVRAARPSS